MGQVCEETPRTFMPTGPRQACRVPSGTRLLSLREGLDQAVLLPWGSWEYEDDMF